jgi:hypothetical protein
MAASPPRHAWDWFARQRRLWPAVRADLADRDEPLRSRYGLVEAREDVMGLLRQDYPGDPVVVEAVHRHVDAQVFLGRADRGLEALGIRNAPRGLRWWWSAVTGLPDTTARPRPRPERQLALDLGGRPDPGDDRSSRDEVRYGWGD